jgi:hypothetical protein
MTSSLATRALGALALSLGLTLTGFGRAPTAHACRFAPPTPFVVVPNAADTTPPMITEATIFDLSRGSAGGQGCSGGRSSCDDIGRLVLDLAATDDLSLGTDIGFRVRVVEGSLPRGALPGADIVDVSTIRFFVAWSEQEPESFDAVLEVVAVDRAGNESAPRRISVESGGAACSTSGGRTGLFTLAPIALAVALIAWRARRRR